MYTNTTLLLKFLFSNDVVREWNKLPSYVVQWTKMNYFALDIIYSRLKILPSLNPSVCVI